MSELRIVGVLPSQDALQAVLDDLGEKGFDRAQFGVLASKDAISGEAAKSAVQIASDPGAPTEAPIEPESEHTLAGALIGGLFYIGAAAAAGAVIMTGGGLGIALAALVGAGGAGGLVGALVAHGIHEDQAKMIDTQIAHGGLVLWIEPRDADQAKVASDALTAGGATHVATQEAA
jgi:hypothetical protein